MDLNSPLHLCLLTLRAVPNRRVDPDDTTDKEDFLALLQACMPEVNLETCMVVGVTHVGVPRILHTVGEPMTLAPDDVPMYIQELEEYRKGDDRPHTPEPICPSFKAHELIGARLRIPRTDTYRRFYFFGQLKQGTSESETVIRPLSFTLLLTNVLRLRHKRRRAYH